VEQLVTVELFGQPYKFKAQTENAKAQQVADLLVNEVARVQSKQAKETPGINHIAILIIAALNIASENLEIKKNYTELVRDISERSAFLIRQLDARIH